jgi:hypothetical protein
LGQVECFGTFSSILNHSSASFKTVVFGERDSPQEKRKRTDSRRSLKRRGALVPEEQAQPMLLTEIENLERKALQEGNVEMTLVLRIGWLTASRISELLTRKAEDVVEKGNSGNWMIFHIKFAGHKGDPFKLWGEHPIHLKRETGLMLSRLKLSRRPEDTLFNVEYQEVVAFIKSEYPLLTGHSIKRGALLALLQNGVPLELIRVAAKHRSIDQLLHYLPADGVARSIGLDKVASCLSGSDLPSQ